MKQKKNRIYRTRTHWGSIAKAIRRYYPDYEIVAFDKNRETLALATQESIINVACTSIDDNFRGCNYISLCAPVAFNTAYLKQMMPYLHDDDMILTDVGSVKLRSMTRSSGWDWRITLSEDTRWPVPKRVVLPIPNQSLIENAYFVLTPSAKVAKKVDAYASFVESLRALPIVLDYHEHDIVTGTISHLPHIIYPQVWSNFVRDNRHQG